MVYLTFIRYAEVKADGCISVKDAKMLFLLAKTSLKNSASRKCFMPRETTGDCSLLE